MNRILPIAMALMMAMGVPASAFAADSDSTVSIQQVRNATVKVIYGDQVFMVDPMLAEKGAYPGFPNTYRSHLRNPLVDLPRPAEELIADVDAVILTHTHLDHWDPAAQAILAKGIPVFVQDNDDATLLKDQGFQDVRVLADNVTFNGVRITRTGGRHGSEEMYRDETMAKALGAVMGFVFQKPNAKTVYIAGDTVWESDVPKTIAAFTPEVIVLNTGDARVDGFEGGIIMGKEDTLRVHTLAPKAKIVAVHMDSINHMTVSRADFRDYVAETNIADAVLIPEDGEIINF